MRSVWKYIRERRKRVHKLCQKTRIQDNLFRIMNEQQASPRKIKTNK